MKILNSKKMHELDALTMERQGLSPSELMERASEKLTEEIVKIVPVESRIKIFCGSGNNGGDGLCIARMLYNQGYDYVTAYKVKDFAAEDDFRRGCLILLYCRRLS